ncbi:hypothetical protein MKEN_00134500 [Mycena kentingensis (nom. inval.)]|nr:hypothetical protein MKEN_00134500 [Mycena kentingensis (nom. inval.)]
MEDNRRVFEVQTFPWNPQNTHTQHMLALVLKWKILRPNDTERGIFYNPLTQTAEFHYSTDEHPSKLARRAIGQQYALSTCGGGLIKANYTARALTGLSRLPTDVQYVEVEAMDGETEEPLAPIGIPVSTERKCPVDGLHYVRMGIRSADISSKRACPKLLIDTGCPVTWMYHREVKQLDRKDEMDEDDDSTVTIVTRTNKPLRRHKDAIWYTSDAAVKLECARDIRIPFGDMFIADFDFYRAPLWLVRRHNRTRYEVAHVPDMIFGQAIFATEETDGHNPVMLRRYDQMDGIFGLGLACSSKYEINPEDGKPDIFVQKFCAIQGYPIASFAVALGADTTEGSSWLILGPADDVIRGLNWSPRMDNGSKVHWTIPLMGMTICHPEGAKEYHLENPRRMIIDTGSHGSTFPAEITEPLYDAMEVSGRLEADFDDLKDKNTPVIFHFGGGVSVTVPGLEYLLDGRTGADPDLMPIGFQAGQIGGDKKGPFGLIGAPLLRDLVVEFQYPTGPRDPGGVRFAPRTATTTIIR